MNEQLLKILACPACQSQVEYKDKQIVCLSCENKYPVRDGVPIMIIEEAKNGK